MSDFSKISFSSAYRYERVVLKGSVGFNLPGSFFGITTVTVTHNLGYKPYFKARYTYGNGKYYDLYPGAGSFNIDGNSGQVDNVYPDSTNLVIEMANFGIPAISGTIYYRMYAEAQ